MATLTAAQKKAAAKKAADKKAAAAAAAAAVETKAQKFSRLGAMRTTKAMNAMRGLRKLANSNNYDYTPEQVEKIIAALKAELEAVHEAFNTTGAPAKETFTL